ncbi:hypothetical protein JTB14_000927 [Gonioctena quinquepunctata]|nr:hypothetical protein JTB14_000927 [Gonioctena quinquepunctata]
MSYQLPPIEKLKGRENYDSWKETKTTKEACENLAKAFEDTGLRRKVGLLRTLISTRLEDCPSVEEYVNKIIQTAYKLSCIDMKASDEWVGAILLAGLPDQYKPMIMGIETSGIKVTADAIKTKLLQNICVEKSKKGSAMFGYGNKNSSLARPRSQSASCIAADMAIW